MGRRSFLPPFLSEAAPVFGRFRLPADGKESRYHLMLARLTGQLSHGPVTAWRTSEWSRTPIYGAFRYRALRQPAAPQFVSLPPRAVIVLHDILPMASGLLLNPNAAESMRFGSAMRMA